jgi:hypothetical protein
MSCTRVTKKSYASRPSPPYHASACQNQVMAGNDGSLYKSTPDKRGVYTWKKAEKNHRNAPGRKTMKKTKGSKLYVVHDNGDQPFTVEDIPSQKTAVIYANTINDYSGEVDSKKEIMRMKYHWICFGDPKSAQFGEYDKGCTVLIQKDKNEYYYVSRTVMKFSLAPGDEVETFLNPIGPSDVPYASIIGTKNVYFLLEQKMIPITMMDPTKDIYYQLYGFGDFKGKSLKKKATNMKFKYLFKSPLIS